MFAAAAVILLVALGAAILWLSSTAQPAVAPPLRDNAEPPPQASASSESGSAYVELPAPTFYTVEPGDSLAAIAENFGTSVDVLRVANGVTNVDMLQIGQVLTVPPAGILIESIDPGLTLNDAARWYEVNPSVLAAYNRLDEARADVPLGRDELIVPDRSRLAPPAAEASSTSSTGGETLYTVMDGDTLLSIAADFNVDPAAIVAANQLEDANRIASGTQLRIPSAR